MVVELKREAMGEIVLNQLYRHTPLQTSFGVNMLALSGGKPILMNLKDVIVAFIAFREQVIVRRTSFELGKTRERAHVLVGLAIAVANIDAVIALIRGASDPNVAREQLMARAWPAGDVEPLVQLIDEPGRSVAEDGTYRLSEAQARAILETAPAAPDRPGTRQDRRGIAGAGQEHRRLPGYSGIAARAGRTSCEPNWWR